MTPKGFTQHEHLNQLELIHMNGRAYDYHLGRFTGVDPFIQFPLNSQSLNPYSYILNNPLSGTDPSGYVACGDVSTDTAGSGSCTYTTSGGEDVEVDYKVGKNGDVRLQASSSGFSAVINDNMQRAENGGAVPMGVTGTSAEGRKQQNAAVSEKGKSSINEDSKKNKNDSFSKGVRIQRENGISFLGVRADKRTASRSQVITSEDAYVGIGDAQKIGAAFDVVRETCPSSYNCELPPIVGIVDLGEGALGYTDVFTRALVINNRILDFEDDPFNPYRLLSTVYHESMHRGQGFMQRFFGGLGDAVNWITPEHQLIYDRSHDLTMKNLWLFFQKLDNIQEMRLRDKDSFSK